MAGFMFFVALLFGVEGVVLGSLTMRLRSAPMAISCSASHLLCTHPDYLWYAAGVALVLAAGFKIGSTLSE